MKKLMIIGSFSAVLLALPAALSAQVVPPPTPAQTAMTTKQFCDSQADLVLAMKPMIDAVAADVTPPAGRTTADVSNFFQMGFAFGFGERCSWLRLNDLLVDMKAQIAALQAQLNTVSGTVAIYSQNIAAATQAANDAKATAQATAVTVTKLAGQVKNAGSALTQP